MIINDLPLHGLKAIKLELRADNRGFFTEIFNNQNFKEAGLPTEFAQDNHSRSAPGVIRGLHFQRLPKQDKILGVIRGRILDVVVDIRPDSPTFGKFHAQELSDKNGTLLWIPSGFAHGFLVLGDEPADILYKVTGFYNRDTEGGIRYDDGELNIPWGVKNPMVSERDKALPGWREYCDNPLV